MRGHYTEVAMVFGKQYDAISRRCAAQLPLHLGRLRFTVEPIQPDWLVVTEPNRVALTTTVPRERRMLMVGEPSPLCNWPADYVNQFGILLSPYAIKSYRGEWIESHPALPWFVGWNRETGQTLSLEDLTHLPVPEKRDAVSVVVSRKVVHAGHRNRLRFLDRLQSKLGDRLQIFGRGIREVNDKLDAILPFKYHLALENTYEPNYWTEKLPDAFLGYALPLYSGCPNIGQWFSDETLVRLDLNDHSRAIEQVTQILSRDTYASYLAGIHRARHQILTQENLFQVVARNLRERDVATKSSSPLTIAPIAKLGLTKRLQLEAHRVFRQVTTKIPRAA